MPRILVILINSVLGSAITKSGSTQNLGFEPVQEELLSTLDVKAKLEERLEKFAKETAFLKKKADDYSNELRDLILKVRRYKRCSF